MLDFHFSWVEFGAVVALAFSCAFGLGYACHGCDSGPRVHLEWKHAK